MPNRTVIFQVKDGRSIEDLSQVFTGFLERPKRLYEIADKLALLERTSDVSISSLTPIEADVVFARQIFPFLSRYERELYLTYLVELEDNKALDLITTLKQHASVDFAQLSLTYSVSFEPKISSLTANRGLARMKCPDAWNIAEGKDIVVAVIDSGVDYEHLYLKQRMWTDCEGKYGKDFRNNSATPDKPMDEYGHGTHCAGIIAATNTEQMQIAVAPKAKIMALKIFNQPEENSNAECETPPCARAIKYAVDNKAAIISNSWKAVDPESHDHALRKALDYAYANGCIVVFAAGNQARDIENCFPANYAKVISVAATTDGDQVLGDSNYGRKITIAAPGERILSVYFHTDGGLVESFGTSAACPHISGLIGLLLQINNNFTFCQIKDILTKTGDRVAALGNLGEGKRANAFKSVTEAVRMAQSMPTSSTPVDPCSEFGHVS